MWTRFESLRAVPGQHFQSNACTTLLDEAKDFRGLARQIDDDSVGSKLRCRTSIHDPDTGRRWPGSSRKPCADT